MSDKMGAIIAFVAGAAIGSIVTWKLVEKKYKVLADEEIESVREVYKRKLDEKQKEKTEEKEENKDRNEKNNHAVLVHNLGYSGEYNEEEIGEVDVINPQKEKVYVIPPENFGELDYEMESLTYYADGVLAFDLTNVVVQDKDSLVGRGSLNTFGEYEPDSVYVRNDNLKKDFEILLDRRKFSDVVSDKPHYVTDDD